MHLFDLRHPPTAQDIETWQQLSVLSPERIVVGTKSDRVSKSKLRQHQKMIASALMVAPDDVVLCSAESRDGRAALWARIIAATKTAIIDEGASGADAPPSP